MATPPFLNNWRKEDSRYHMFGWDSMRIDEFLSNGSLFHYRLPKNMNDQGPRVIVEAMASGIPVIAEPRDGAADRITEDTGWLRSDNAGFVSVVESIADDITILEEKGVASRRRAREEFNPWKWVEHMLDIRMGSYPPTPMEARDQKR